VRSIPFGPRRKDKNSAPHRAKVKKAAVGFVASREGPGLTSITGGASMFGASLRRMGELGIRGKDVAFLRISRGGRCAKRDEMSVVRAQWLLLHLRGPLRSRRGGWSPLRSLRCRSGLFTPRGNGAHTGILWILSNRQRRWVASQTHKIGFRRSAKKTAGPTDASNVAGSGQLCRDGGRH